MRKSRDNILKRMVLIEKAGDEHRLSRLLERKKEALLNKDMLKTVQVNTDIINNLKSKNFLGEGEWTIID